jgi:hypothetical protein
MTDLGIADMTRGMRKKRRGGGQQRADLEITVTSECSDGDVVTGIVDVAKIVETANIDQN